MRGASASEFQQNAKRATLASGCSNSHPTPNGCSRNRNRAKSAPSNLLCALSCAIFPRGGRWPSPALSGPLLGESRGGHPMKSLLIATTALVSVFSLTSAAGQPAPLAASNHYVLDANLEFLCHYGFAVSTTTTSSLGSVYDYWKRAATPVIGKGKKVTEIMVADAPLESSAPSGFSVKIYSSRMNRPYEELVSATAGQPQRCGPIKVPISPTYLAKGKKYWVVERALEPYFQSGDGGITNSIRWLYDKKRTSGARWQAGSCVGSSCHSSASWQPITGGVPYVRFK